jgi:LemA protein
MTGLYIFLGIVVVIFLWAMANYNALVRLRNHCREAWSNVDTELKRRYNLIPNLVEAVKGYAKHEKEVLERVVQARAEALNSTGSAESQAQHENALVGSLKTLFAVSEDYPDLKANENFLQLQHELSNTEDRIQAARRFFNANVRDLNTRTEVFPSSIIANMFGFQREEYFQIESLEMREPVKVDLDT